MIRQFLATSILIFFLTETSLNAKVNQHIPINKDTAVAPLSTLQIHIVPKGSYYPIITPKTFVAKWLKAHLNCSGAFYDNLQTSCTKLEEFPETYKLVFYKVNNLPNLDANALAPCSTIFTYLQTKKAIGLLFILRNNTGRLYF